MQKEYSAAYAPLPLEQQPLDGEAYNAKARFLRTETAPSDTPADKPVPAEDAKVYTPVSSADGKLAIAGEWFVKDVERSFNVRFDGKEARAAMGMVEFVGKLRESENFEMDVTLGGFPMIVEMKEESSQKLLRFSNGGLWSKGAPLKN